MTALRSTTLVGILVCLSSLGTCAWMPRPKISRASKLHMSDEASVPDLSGKIVYQRVRHGLSPQSDVDMHDALTIEERIRFQADPNRPGYLLPIGKRTLILLDKAGQEFYRMDVNEAKPTHAGFDRTLHSTLVMILYLASSPTLLKGNVLELESQTGIGGLLGCIGMASVLGQDATTESSETDILPEKEKNTVHFPAAVKSLVLADANEEMLNVAFENIKHSGVVSSLLSTRQLGWNKHPRIKDDDRYSTILGCDLLFSYPTAKELARTAAFLLEPSGVFCHVCPDNREDLAYLRNFMERGYRMNVNHEYLKLQTQEFTYQTLPIGTAEEELPELGDVQNVRESTFECLVAFHHADYDGINGEYFFPMETGQYDGSSRNTYLETEGEAKPW